MRYTRLIPIRVLGLAASAVHAQSAVTLFGIVDQGSSYTSNAGGKSQWSMAGGVLQGSRWGLPRSIHGPRAFEPQHHLTNRPSTI
ncbi:porin [Caballeronia sp. LZ019]|uniref:porin n=1 Tax=Caballeronia sp. LZ019 TaxID=3038555 RepID=UPI002855B7C1|nr:porin [Caballeronia sp. LZ019]MDR5809207.1 porin [Caballeronia sp. LZ019]